MMTAAAQHQTRVVIRKPLDNCKFSGLILAESMHPSGNAWMFHFTHLYSMTGGHIGLDILTSTPAGFAEFNAARYKELQIEQGQASEILAQVGALMKSKQGVNPLSPDPLKGLYKYKKDYQTKFERRVNEMTRQGWSLPVCKDYVVADAARANFQRGSN